ncbi:hypothetical protein GJ496_005696 [Pomphorhynchus laevis]|nr:hypothetical protein GJ496_005696 [Pomphorhynchus laevis]
MRAHTIIIRQDPPPPMFSVPSSQLNSKLLLNRNLRIEMCAAKSTKSSLGLLLNRDKCEIIASNQDDAERILVVLPGAK